MKAKEINVRHEHKYLLHQDEYLRLSEVLKRILKPDPNSLDGNGYHIRSLYFDDIYDTALREKYLGIPYRRKFRVRIYNFSDELIQLEEKIKYGDYIQKKSSRISLNEFKRIFKGDAIWMLEGDDPVKRDYYMQIRNNMLRPKVIVDYHREAHVLPYNQIRITFDKNLSAAHPTENIFDKNLCSFGAGDEKSVILEIKYNNFLPVHIKRILEIHCTNRLSVSKYVLCRERLKKY